MISLLEFAMFYKTQLSLRQCALHFGITYYAARMMYHQCVKEKLLEKPAHARRGNQVRTEERKAALADQPPPPIAGRLHTRAAPVASRPGVVSRFILTCAQNNTTLHEPLWENMKALALHYRARIIVARSIYSRFADAATMDKKLIISGERSSLGSKTYTWDDRLKQYFVDERLQLVPGLEWCGETNVIPTAAQPLTGFDTYTGRASAIIPHPRIAMRSVASHPTEGTKLLFTTGTLTHRNYIQRKAGQLAEFHHCYGGLLVEVDAEGTWFARQLNADSDGTLHDWDLRVEGGRVSKGNSIEAINWGDIHVAYGDPASYELAWGKDGILDQLQPSYQFMHDLVDFRVRNPHVASRNLHLDAFIAHVLGHRSVEKEMIKTAEVLRASLRRDVTETVVVNSNHDNFLVQWLSRTGDFRRDPYNAVYFLKAALYLWHQTALRSVSPNMTQWAMEQGCKLLVHREDLKFLGEDESFIICPKAHGGIESGMHGHLGPNGARGSPAALAKMGRKGNIGHHHSAGIYDGLYVAGILGSLDQQYNEGPSSWTQSNILTYPNGKRAIQTIYDGKARA